jgi:hypothetical protein
MGLLDRPEPPRGAVRDAGAEEKKAGAR